jgi:hypothetical protein
MQRRKGNLAVNGKISSKICRLGIGACCNRARNTGQRDRKEIEAQRKIPVSVA